MQKRDSIEASTGGRRVPAVRTCSSCSTTPLRSSSRAAAARLKFLQQPPDKVYGERLEGAKWCVRHPLTGDNAGYTERTAGNSLQAPCS